MTLNTPILHSSSSKRCLTGLRSGLCGGQLSSSTPNSSNHAFMDHVLCTGAKSCWDRTVPTTLEAENHPKCLGRHKDFSSLQLQGPGQSPERKWLRGMAKHFCLYNLCMLSSISSHCNWNCAGSFKLETQQRMITGWGEGSNAYVLIKGVGQKKTKRLVLG